MINEIIKMIAITFVPTLELRASIPYGIFAAKISWLIVFAVCVVANIIVGILIYLLMDLIIKIITKIPVITKVWDNYVAKTQQKIQKGVDKYGKWALAIFIGIPLPGSGVYTGALAAYLIGLRFKKFMVANVIGVIIAGIAVTVICLTGASVSNIFIKQM
ncbi:MAG TPA: small multi-drug export protein [Candidatus Marinimicrobia bacterium]|jgi:uncharacterized membrane protein|nr:small multi-drug export protein [Candidatus Neomarinimicrobiota bacterium]HOV24217.1 small multi-drug export protein [Candidatus Neomarinimicrobiota bacterium]HQC63131.1 small multi-drug export protein [Candidatus Neomarinimicrobiota bacterium]HQE96477.1 small multi-drug export protein [Candidatus Neomarinimicrobiota bacterium]HQK11503.1 small multi-drug export protein [Candidatus Neomarinimicrobiota bacterium]